MPRPKKGKRYGRCALNGNKIFAEDKMAKQWKKVAACVLVAAMAVPTVAALAACKDDVVIKPGYRTYTSVMPSTVSYTHLTLPTILRV